MTEGTQVQMIQIPIGEIDEYLAERFLESSNPVRFSASLEKTEGLLEIVEIDPADADFGKGIDFELSTCECMGLEDLDLSELSGITVYTSSAYEFFEYYLDFRDSIKCTVKFSENTWMIKLD